jgi:hypothetical protein
MLWLTVSWPVYLGVKSNLGSKTRFLLLSAIATAACMLMWGALSDERMGLSFAIAADPCQHSLSWVRVPQDPWLYLYLRFKTPTTWRPRSPYLYPQEQGGPFIPPGTVSFFVTFYDPQGYTVSIPTLLHTSSHSALSTWNCGRNNWKRKKMYKKLIQKLKFIG